MNIFPFEVQHASGVVDLILPIQQIEFEVPVSLEAQPDLQEIPRFYQHGNGNFWVAVHAQEVVGTVALLDIGNNQVALRKMFVGAGYRGPRHGTASRLLGTVVAWCQARGVQEIYLGTTAKFLAAHRFYEKNGFHEIARTALPASFPVMLVDTKFYRRVL
ncbi:GNAT family N-acetyltransferase [Pseudoxanthomonas sp.]|uniref:GNAT family N-acetyltransferase n=1 Tax=Pseudoxanthomonas sp. TaxID=1871049 RepID=UPI00263247A7|nr:GNAT family N-acetyltransferase [Pseudoxanthomonas sp.]WDS35248.1 MAG: GNAT family N-acetyltransferase [Pseudoxanthomonas sp.]